MPAQSWRHRKQKIPLPEKLDRSSCRWGEWSCKHNTFISSGCMLLSRLSRMFSDFPCVLDSSSARTPETDVQNNCRSSTLPESILQYLLTIAQKQFTETFPFLGSKIFPCITSIKEYYYSLLDLSRVESSQSQFSRSLETLPSRRKVTFPSTFIPQTIICVIVSPFAWYSVSATILASNSVQYTLL